MARTSLMTWIFFWPAPARTTLNSVFSSAAGDGPPPGARAGGPRLPPRQRHGRHLRDVLADDSVASRHLSAADLDRLFEPASYVGMAAALVDRVLSSAEHRRATGTGRDTATDAGVARPPEAEQLAPRIRTGRAAARSILIWAHTGHVPGALPDARRASRVPCRLPPAPVVGSPLVYATAAVHIRMVPSGE